MDCLELWNNNQIVDEFYHNEDVVLANVVFRWWKTQ
jgi:hypothetical protein